MAATLARVMEELDPLDTDEHREAARALVRHILNGTPHVLLRLPGGEEYRLDGTELRALLAVASARADGQRVSVISHDVMLSPQQAAELLGVSRPMVYRFIERGDLDATRVGTHWRLVAADVLALADRRSRLTSEVDAGLQRVTEVMASRDDEVSGLDAKESWRSAGEGRREASLERVRCRAKGQRK
ncbi:helix-turn-helix domain-containing protein [Nocardiopsis sp. CNT312]|uniref:helix-turn-helix domain-containing protein n=1 Tax=Nocardiopsis sp. CNT312 TaxID=1137268 RepID=UPI0004B1DDA8|nr:helix-turn-helix domain-containing protein [Nocardiopsis sp. CNT312]